MAMTFLHRKARPALGQAGDGSGRETEGFALALIPLGVAAVLAALMLPRAVPPTVRDIPRPAVDERALAASIAADDARAARARTTPLSPELRAIGTAVRAFNVQEALGEDAVAMGKARDAINAARRVAMETGNLATLIDLRALQMAGFLAEVRRFERTGEISRELTELGGTFVQRMTQFGWCVGRHVLMSEEARRVAFKVTWNKLLYLDGDPMFAPTLDEQRVLYSFYLTHAHPSEAQRPLLDALRRSAHDAASSKHVDDRERAATAAWLLPKIGELARLDPTYPEPLARAVVFYLRGEYTGATLVYEAWLSAHPSGPWTLRAQNHLRASVLAEQERLE